RSWFARAVWGSPQMCYRTFSSPSSRPRNRGPAWGSALRFHRASSVNSVVRSSRRTGRKVAPSSRSSSCRRRRRMMPDAIKVLLVEDDAAVRIGSEQALQLAGFPVESFESAERVVSCIKPGMRAIVVSDVKLPGMDGLGLLRHEGDLQGDIPVIRATGDGDVAMAVGAFRAAANDLIENTVPSSPPAGVG